MKTLSLALLLSALLGVQGIAEIVRPAPAFSTVAGKSLKSFRGQPVVVLVAPSPRSSAFRKQARRIQEVYQQFAARNVLFMAVFTESAEGVIPSNVPFTLVADGAKVAADYGFNGKFTLYVIGKDGNVDLATEKIVPASRIMDMVYNNAEQQTSQRKL